MNDSEQIKGLLEMLTSDHVEDPVTAIEVLGGIGDEEALTTLRERMSTVANEHYALVVASGKLKRKLGVE